MNKPFKLNLSRRAALLTAMSALVATGAQAHWFHGKLTYPASVIAAGLQNVWDLQFTAGTTGAQTKKAGVDALPAGVTIVKDPAGANLPAAPLNTLKFTASVDMVDWDLTGYCFAFNATITVNFSNCRAQYLPDPAPYRSSYWMALGTLAGTPTVNWTDSTLDFTSYANGNTINHAAGTLNFTRCRLIKASANYVNASRGVAQSTDQCYFSSFAVNAVLGDHLETIHWFQGNINFTNNFVNCLDGPPVPPITATFTGLIFPASTGTMDILVDRCILLGAAALGGNYTYQVRVGAGSMNYTSTNNLMELGTSGYVGETLDAGHGTYVKTTSGNRDWVTGDLISI